MPFLIPHSSHLFIKLIHWKPLFFSLFFAFIFSHFVSHSINFIHELSPQIRFWMMMKMHNENMDAKWIDDEVKYFRYKFSLFNQWMKSLELATVTSNKLSNCDKIYRLKQIYDKGQGTYQRIFFFLISCLPLEIPRNFSFSMMMDFPWCGEKRMIIIVQIGPFSFKFNFCFLFMVGVSSEI